MEPESYMLIVLIAGITIYALLGGADFGAGIWQFVELFRSKENRSDQLLKAIGPVWEANHVWLIFAMMVLFNGFPIAFAALSKALWIPLLLSVWGILFRGASYAFRSYSRGSERELSVWESLFALASSLTPFFLGATAGAIASGNLSIDANGNFNGSYLSDWLSPLSIFTGIFTVSMCAYLSAVYVARETVVQVDKAMMEIWRQRSIGMGIWMGALSLIGVVVIVWSDTSLSANFRYQGWPFVVASAVGGMLSLFFVYEYRFVLAMLCSAIAVSAVIIGWGVAQYPMIVAPNLNAFDVAAPKNVLWLMLYVIALGSIVLLPALLYLFRLFKSVP